MIPMRVRFWLIAAPVAAVGMFVAARPGAADDDPRCGPSCMGLAPTGKAIELRIAERKLWSDHVVWTRQYIVAAVADAPDADAAAKRLMKNQEDLGAAIVPYYGAEAGQKLTALLKEHISIAVDVVAAAKAGDDAKLKAADARWHGNAREIASFLAAANPNWKKDMLVSMLDEHLKLTTDEAVARLHKDWQGDVSAFDKIHEQALKMGDDLAEGIVQQNPKQF